MNCTAKVVPHLRNGAVIRVDGPNAKAPGKFNYASTQWALMLSPQGDLVLLRDGDVVGSLAGCKGRSAITPLPRGILVSFFQENKPRPDELVSLT